MEYHIYIDESRYLEHDPYKYMIIGGVWISVDGIKKLKSDFKKLREQHKIWGEIKWRNVSPSSEKFYQEIIKNFFNNVDLQFRCITVNKTNLDHKAFNQEGHDEFYYKVCYRLLIGKIETQYSYRIFLDYKDKYNSRRIKTLKRCLIKKLHDQEEEIILPIQAIRSEHSQILQLCDLLIGAVGYERNNLGGSKAKLKIVNYILGKTDRENFTNNSPLSEKKFNIFNMLDY